jgi:phosphorylcholine metabolism protein LicD
MLNDTDYQLLLRAIKIVEKCEIKYWLTGGVLLGIIRNQSLIPHDGDLDLAMYKTQATPEILNKLTIEMEKIGFLLLKQSENRIKFKHNITNTKFEIFYFRKYLKYYWAYCWKGYHYYPKRYLDTLEVYECNGFKFAVPNDPKGYLKYKFGPNWTKPIKNFKKPRDYHNYFPKNLNYRKILKNLKEKK